MIAVVIAMAVLVAVGAPIARVIDPSLSVGAAVGSGFLIGCGVVSLVMMGLTAAGLSWSFFVLLMPMAAVAVVAARLASRAAGDRDDSSRNVLETIVDALTVISVAGYALFATLARPWEWDFWAIWGLKARVFMVARGIDGVFLSNPDVYYSHPDYPPLLPLLYDFTSLVRGSWDDRWIGLTFVAFAGALLLVIRDEIRRATGSRLFSAVATLALSGAACSPFVGLGDGPLVAFGTAGLVILARGARSDDRRAILLGGVLLGLGAMTKNEGIALAFAAAVSLLIMNRRQIAAFAVPVVLLNAPWMIWRATLDLETDVIAGSLVSRVAERLSDPAGFLSALANGTPDRAGFWVILIALLLAGGSEVVRKHGVMLIAVLVQLICYVGIYAGTVHDLASHVQTSMGRISGHLAAAVGALCALAIWDLLLRKEIAPAPKPGGEPRKSADGEESADVEP